ncbi:hypothetical protein [uncultured Sphaerochaeta sp.]|uniref:ABC transporter permease n=1 Tax=uncultured Sphaerochaeta sp. TaxID=886478 RepID=UPI002A0A603F|nr:hypothetical protein [uncultured Sphaerochaeta sp.]
MNNIYGLLQRSLKEGVTGYLKRNLGILAGLFIMCISMAIVSPAFLRSSNILNVLRQVSTNGMLAFGMTLAIIIGGIDLSVGSVLALGGTVAAGLIAKSGVPVPLAVLIGCGIGAGIGFFQWLCHLLYRNTSFYRYLGHDANCTRGGLCLFKWQSDQDY